MRAPSIFRQMFAAILLSATPLFAVDIEHLQRDFDAPPADARPMMRWWWFGPAVTKPELEREMKLMKDGGFGGFEVQPVYPLSLDDKKAGIKNLKFMSPEFLDMLHFTASKAKELGLRMDLTLGSGWPYGGAQVPITEAAPRLRWERVAVTGESRRVSVPNMATSESLIAAFAAGSSRILTNINNGVLLLPDDGERPKEVWFFVASRTRQKVKRAAFGAEGFVLNHYNRPAVESYLQHVGEPMLKALQSNPPYAIFCDSLEVYGSDWTDDFLDQFRQRRGYDLKPYLPALVTETPVTAAVRHDWGQTLTELLDERFFVPLHNWARAHRTLLRIQGYGTPPATLACNAHADLTEGEGHDWRRLSATRWASSANHLFGRNVTSSETWTWLHSPVFRATPLDMKAEADRHFLQGINQLIGHGWPYTPPGVEYPGWRFYAAAVFDEKNPWWIVMPDVTKYLQRVSFMMRQGQPVNDVAVYLPTSDAWASLTPGQVNLYETLSKRIGTNVVTQILDAGYGLDFIDDGTFDVGLIRYRVVVLPGVETIPAATLRKLDEFVRAGGVLVAIRRLPETTPGLMATDADKAGIRAAVSQFFETTNAPAHFVADETQLGDTLTALVRPDVSLSPSAAEIGFVHRKTDSADIYFLANTGNTPKNVKATFRVQGMQPEWWDPMSGRVSAANVLDRPENSATIAIALEPYASQILVFTKRSLPRSERGLPARPIAKAVAPMPIDLSNNWRVTFKSAAPGDNPTSTRMETLRSWTDDDATKNFSGMATYEKRVVVPRAMLKNGLNLRLDFGEGKPGTSQDGHGHRAMLDAPVREAAIVYVNGKRAGAAWCPPYSVDVTGLLKNGENIIRIEVANLAVNYMAAHLVLDYQEQHRDLIAQFGDRFQPQDINQVKPVPSGLLGLIQLVARPQTNR